MKEVYLLLASTSHGAKVPKDFLTINRIRHDDDGGGWAVLCLWKAGYQNLSCASSTQLNLYCSGKRDRKCKLKMDQQIRSFVEVEECKSQAAYRLVSQGLASFHKLRFTAPEGTFRPFELQLPSSPS